LKEIIIYNRYISLDELVAKVGIGAHGLLWKEEDVYEELKEQKSIKIDGKIYPSIEEDEEDIDACDAVLYMDLETNDKIVQRAFEEEEHKTGLLLTDLSKDNVNIKYSFSDLIAKPCRTLNSPIWSGITNGKTTCTGYHINILKKLP
jgi:nitrate reductase alpha subunit